MPALPPVPGCLKAVITWQPGPGVVAQNVHHYGYSGTAPIATDLTALAVHLQTLIVANFIPLCCNPTTYESVQLTDLASSTGLQATVSAPTPGTEAGLPLPAQVSALVNYHIVNRYRGGKPRSYYPFGNEAALQGDNAWQSSFIGAVTNAATNVIIGMSNFTSGGTVITGMVAVSYYQGYNAPVTHPGGRVTQTPALRPGGPVKYAVTTATCNPKIATQRRRIGR
jgi:hypothetical protein